METGNAHRLAGKIASILENEPKTIDLSSLQAGVALNQKTIDLTALTKSVLSQVDTRGHEIRTEIHIKTLNADESRVEPIDCARSECPSGACAGSEPGNLGARAIMV